MRIEDKYLNEVKLPKNRIKGYKVQKDIKSCYTCKYGVVGDSFEEEYPGAWECEHPDNQYVNDEQDIVVQYIEQFGICPRFRR